MNGTRIKLKDALDMTSEKFCKMQEELERSSSDEAFEDKALEKFVKEPEKSILSGDNFKVKTDFLFLSFLFIVILFASIVSGVKGSMEEYVAIPIAGLSLLGMIITAKDIKKDDEENRKRNR